MQPESPYPPQQQPSPYGQQQPPPYGQQPSPYGQQQPPPYGQQPVAPPSYGPGSAPLAYVPPGPARPGRSRAVPVLVVVVSLLGLALLGMGTFVAVRVIGLRGDIAALKQDLAGYDQRDAADKATLDKKFVEADLAGKLQAVKDLTVKVEDAVIAWDAMSEADQDRNVYTIQVAREKCVDAVIAYDQAAAAFPTSMLNGLPPQIDLNDSSTDCLR